MSRRIRESVSKFPSTYEGMGVNALSRLLACSAHRFIRLRRAGPGGRRRRLCVSEWNVNALVDYERRVVPVSLSVSLQHSLKTRRARTHSPEFA